MPRSASPCRRAKAGLEGRHDRGARSRRHLPQSRLHAEEGAGRRSACAARDRPSPCPLHQRRQAHARLGGADRPREGDDLGHPGFARRDAAGPWRRADPRSPAKFVGPNTVEAGGRTLEAKHIVIATGSTPRPLPIPGAELMITSDEVLSERELPESVLFVGGGVIALEFGHVYARAGAKVTILEVLPQLLPALDADAVEQVRKESERIGIDVHTGVKVKRVETDEQTPAHRVRGRRQGDERQERPRGERRRPHRQCRSARSRCGRRSPMRASASRSTRRCARPPTRRSISAATCCRVRRSSRRSPPMRGGWSGATSSRAQAQARLCDACPPASTPCRRSPPSACPRPRPRRRVLKTRVQVNDMEYWFSTRTFAETRCLVEDHRR